jgi:hypothetical protein
MKQRPMKAHRPLAMPIASGYLCASPAIAVRIYVNDKAQAGIRGDASQVDGHGLACAGTGYRNRRACWQTGCYRVGR